MSRLESERGPGELRQVRSGKRKGGVKKEKRRARAWRLRRKTGQRRHCVDELKIAEEIGEVSTCSIRILNHA